MSTPNLFREYAFRFLFHLGLPIFEEDIQKLKSSTKAEWEREFSLFSSSTDDLSLSEQEMTKAKKVAMGTIDKIEEIKEKIAGTAKNWRLDRMARVDYTLLLMATYEGNFEDPTKKIVINEAIELAKKYGNAESSKFINGILDQTIG